MTTKCNIHPYPLHTANLRPTISGTKYFNVSVDEASNTYTVTVTDADGDKTILYSVYDVPAGATFDNSTGDLVWTPTGSDSVNLTYVHLIKYYQ